jgi:protein involved in polysaccharide export with SLBB domain
MEELRMRGERVAELAAFVGGLSPSARDEAMRRYPELSAAIVAEPEAWIVRAAGSAGEPAARRVVEARLVRAGARAAVVRRRTWIE